MESRAYLNQIISYQWLDSRRQKGWDGNGQVNRKKKRFLISKRRLTWGNHLFCCSIRPIPRFRTPRSWFYSPHKIKTKKRFHLGSGSISRSGSPDQIDIWKTLAWAWKKKKKKRKFAFLVFFFSQLVCLFFCSNRHKGWFSTGMIIETGAKMVKVEGSSSIEHTDRQTNGPFAQVETYHTPP